MEDWKRVLWSDETKINRIGSDGRVYTWKEKGTPLSDRTTPPSVKHGGGNNLMVWGCMGWNGVGKLTEVERKTNAVQYHENLGDGWWKASVLYTPPRILSDSNRTIGLPVDSQWTPIGL